MFLDELTFVRGLDGSGWEVGEGDLRGRLVGSDFLLGRLVGGCDA